VKEAVAAVLHDLHACPDVRVIVSAGAAGTFCAGLDLIRGPGEGPRAGGCGFAGIVPRRPAKLVIAAVEGCAPWSSGSRDRGKEVEAQRF
jgi:enoyl-CoA hydratase